MKSFEELSLVRELEQALQKLKFNKPTEVQSAVIPVAMEGRDLMACAETGSGKTAAFGIPMITKLLEDSERNALVLAPTRELAHQTSDFLRELSSFCRNIRITSLVGGADMRKQLRSIEKRPRIVVATPGRLIDHLRRKSLKLDTTEILVLDEGDRMLDMGFAPQLDQILKYLPAKRQTSLFTATLPVKVRELAESYLSNPENINVGRVSLPVASIKQSILQLKHFEKEEKLLDELNKRKGSVIIFSQTKRRTDKLARTLTEYGHSVGLIHGDRSQGQRNQAIRRFKNSETRILCATDIAARGIDVPQVEHVINYDLPRMHEDYVHRVGRTARNGAKGEALSFITPEDIRSWQMLARKYKIEGVELVGVPREMKGKKAKGKRGRSFKKRSFGRNSSRSNNGGPRSNNKKRSFKNSKPKNSRNRRKAA